MLEAEPLPHDIPQETSLPESEPLPVPDPVVPEPVLSDPVPVPPEPAHEAAPMPPVVAPTVPEHRWGRYSHQEVVVKAATARRSRVEKALDRIMAYVQKKGSISNDEVEKLDKVVDSTAALYLKQLVERHLLRKTGTNRSIRYEKPGSGN